MDIKSTQHDCICGCQSHFCQAAVNYTTYMPIMNVAKEKVGLRTSHPLSRGGSNSNQGSCLHNLDKCCRNAPRHPACHHAAHGTALEPARITCCEQASPSPSPCAPWKYYNVRRGYCDRCIIRGELLAQQRGLDRGLYCRQMGVSYTDLRDANPGMLL